MSNRSKLNNAKSQLLSDPENESIFNLLGRKCITLATAVIQLYLAEETVSRYTWNKHSCGVVCFVKDNPQRSYFFRLYDPKKQHMLWEQEIYNRFKYKAPRDFFHIFEAHDCQVGFNFASHDEASLFRTVVEMKLLERLLNEKKNQPTRDCAEMLATAVYDKDNTETAPRNISHTAPGQSSSGENISQRNFSDNETVKKPPAKKYKGKGKMKLKKTDISTPTQFQHVSHLGYDRTIGLDMLGEQAEVKAMLKAIGISDPSNEDESTIKFIYDFVDTHGGINAVREDLARRQPPKHSPPSTATLFPTTASSVIPHRILPVALGTRTPPVHHNKKNSPAPWMLQPVHRGTPTPCQSPVEHILTTPILLPSPVNRALIAPILLQSSVKDTMTTPPPLIPETAPLPLPSPVKHTLTTPFPLQSCVEHTFTPPILLPSPIKYALETHFPLQSSVEHTLTPPIVLPSPIKHALTTPFPLQSSVEHTLTPSILLPSPIKHALATPFPPQSSVEHTLTPSILLPSPIKHTLATPFPLQSSVEHTFTPPIILPSPIKHALITPFPLQSSVEHTLTPLILLSSPIKHALTTPIPPQSSVGHILTPPILLRSPIKHALTTPFPLQSSAEHTLTPPILLPSPVKHTLTTPFPLQSSVKPKMTIPPPPIPQREYIGAPVVSALPPNRDRLHSAMILAPQPPESDTTLPKSSYSVAPAAPPPPPMNIGGDEPPLSIPNSGRAGLLDSIHMGTKLKHVDPCQGVTTSDARDGILSQIRGGTTLKPVDYTDSQTPVQQPNDILGALAAALAQRKDAIQGSDDMDDSSDDVGDEDDADEWDD